MRCKIGHINYRHKLCDFRRLYCYAAYFDPSPCAHAVRKRKNGAQQQGTCRHGSKHHRLFIQPSVIKQPVSHGYHNNAYNRNHGMLYGIFISLVSPKHRACIGAGKNHHNAYKDKRKGYKHQREADSALYYIGFF